MENQNINLDDILALATAAVTIASIIVKITPDQTDNKIVDTILNILNVISINNKKRGEK
jgi:Na+-transporting NADH:ubiquinone oxidoreductase subunit NqrC